MATKKIKKDKEAEPTAAFSVKLVLKDTDEVLTGLGDTLLDALCDVKLKGVAKTIGILTMARGEKKIARVLNAPKINRIFNTEGNQEVKRLSAQSFVKFIKNDL